jgi:hypothetical protein
MDNVQKNTETIKSLINTFQLTVNQFNKMQVDNNELHQRIATLENYIQVLKLNGALPELPNHNEK